MDARTRWTTLLVAVTVAASGCVGTDVGNPQDDSPEDREKTDAELRFEGVDRPPQPKALTLPGGFVLDEAWMAVDGAGLRPDGECSERAPRQADRSLVVDLLADETTRRTVLPEVEAGRYCGLDVYLAPVSESEHDETDSLPGAMVGHSVLLAGERGDGTEFRLEADLERRIAIRADAEGFVLSPDRRQFLLVAALRSWIDRERLDEFADGDGPIVIDAERHPDAYEHFREAVGETIFLYRDTNGNGQLEPDERGERLGSNVPFDERPDASELRPDAGMDDDDRDDERPDAGD